MLVGLFLLLHQRRDATGLEMIYRYGQRHDWVMGQGPKARTYLRPELRQTLYFLTGRPYKGIDGLAPDGLVWVMPRKDHEVHVVMIHLLVRSLVVGHVTDAQLTMIKSARDKYPDNAFYSAMAARFGLGEWDEVWRVLADERVFPADRLPTTRDRCVNWLWMRDPGSDNWQACGDRVKTHSGGDLTFTVWLAAHK
jgi:hypothetical protein